MTLFVNSFGIFWQCLASNELWVSEVFKLAVSKQQLMGASGLLIVSIYVTDLSQVLVELCVWLGLATLEIAKHLPRHLENHQLRSETLQTLFTSWTLACILSLERSLSLHGSFYQIRFFSRRHRCFSFHFWFWCPFVCRRRFFPCGGTFVDYPIRFPFAQPPFVFFISKI